MQVSSQQTLVRIYLPRKEGKLSYLAIGGKESRSNVQISAEPGSNWGPCGRKAEILQLRQPCPPSVLKSCNYYIYTPLIDIKQTFLLCVNQITKVNLVPD